MKSAGNTVLITGGATGIGFSLAEAFIQKGNEVIICGRRESKLREAKQKLPQIHARACDVSSAKERESLFSWVRDNFGSVNILINNAGIQRTINFKNGAQDFISGESEIETNLTAPIHLSALFIPLFLKQPQSAIVNISSSLGFMPRPHIPIYCVTKAGVHTFSMVLREQLKDTSVNVFEIVPPLVDTDLFKVGKDQRKLPFKGIPPSRLAEAILKALENDEYEIVVGEAIRSVTERKVHLEQMLQHHKTIPS